MSQELASQLEQLTEAAADVAAPRSPGAWSKLEILGHLIDSAANNHQRFVRAQRVDELRFPPYDPPTWVADQRYRESGWDRLVDLWVAYNRHLVQVVRVMPDDQLDTSCWVDWEGTLAPIPLRAVIDAYLAHMRHHLEQLRG